MESDCVSSGIHPHHQLDMSSYNNLQQGLDISIYANLKYTAPIDLNYIGAHDIVIHIWSIIVVCL